MDSRYDLGSSVVARPRIVDAAAQMRDTEDTEVDMTAERVSELVELLDEAFVGPRWHALLINLESVAPDDWLWVAPGGQRSIRDIVAHVGGCKFMYRTRPSVTASTPGTPHLSRTATRLPPSRQRSTGCAKVTSGCAAASPPWTTTSSLDCAGIIPGRYARRAGSSRR